MPGTHHGVSTEKSNQGYARPPSFVLGRDAFELGWNEGGSTQNHHPGDFFAAVERFSAPHGTALTPHAAGCAGGSAPWTGGGWTSGRGSTRSSGWRRCCPRAARARGEALGLSGFGRRSTCKKKSSVDGGWRRVFRWGPVWARLRSSSDLQLGVQKIQWKKVFQGSRSESLKEKTPSPKANHMSTRCCKHGTIHSFCICVCFTLYVLLFTFFHLVVLMLLLQFGSLPDIQPKQLLAPTNCAWIRFSPWVLCFRCHGLFDRRARLEKACQKHSAWPPPVWVAKENTLTVFVFRSLGWLWG